ncbi:LytR/AlgR family response regulator transcription factor [Listeria booriae]|uniref:Response regulator transcription factor n=1 Tax=Listeria booriae TaxID=1552123 RepID=A0A7X0YKS9_9LIST|nr:LytTR family DNA-binding domain-containing protein [Listeria booriae]MBC2103684.1 response regulator transcription factor [Listeria booriae]MBC2116295.1 response regulator transcription factor [Listeria booriae]
MKKLYVIENEKIQRDTLLQILNQDEILSEMPIEVDQDIATPDALLEDIRRNKGSHIYFLDIDLEARLDGVQLAIKVREIDPKGIIIFLTAIKTRLFETVNLVIEPLAYLVKTNFTLATLQLKIAEITALIRRRYDKTEFLIVEVEGVVHKIGYEHIYFIETLPRTRKTRFHLENEVLSVSIPINELKGKLMFTEFLLDLQSYIINPAKIRNLDLGKRTIVFKNSETVFAGKRTVARVRQSLLATH